MRYITVGLILANGISSLPLTGHDMKEHSRKEKQELTFTSGSIANISVEGDVKDGCKFQFFLENEACCFSTTHSRDRLCLPSRQPSNCRRNDSFTVEEQTGSCVLSLPDFQPEDVGNYRAVFPGSLKDNQDITVFISGTNSLLIVVVVVGLLLILLLCLVRWWWPMRGGGFKKRRAKDEEIAMAILRGESGYFNKYVGDRNFLRVRDNKGNNIFHYAVREDWTDRSTLLLDQELKKRRLSLTDVSNDIQESPVTTSDIFSVKIPNRWYSMPDLHLPGNHKLPGRSHIIDVNTANNLGETPLHIACDRENKPAVEALLKNGARVNVQDLKNSSPVHKAVAKNNLEILTLLLNDERKEEVGLALALRDESDLTPILMAAKLGLGNIVKYFIEELNDETWKADAVSMTYLAVEVGCEDILELLKHNNTGWSKEWRVDDQTFLQKAVMNGNIIAVETIINRRYFTAEDWIPAKNLVEMKLGKDNKWKQILDLFHEEEMNEERKMKQPKDKNKSNNINVVKKGVKKVWSKLKPTGNNENLTSTEEKFTAEDGIETGKEGSSYEANMGYQSDE